MLIVSTNEIPGYDITAILGEVFGVTVRSRNLGSSFSAVRASMGGGEIPQMTQLMLQSRNEAMGRMIQQAQQRGANAIVGFRFDSGDFGGWTEICAYGTAAWIMPVSDYAKQQHEALAQAGGLLPHQRQYSTAVSEYGPPATH